MFNYWRIFGVPSGIAPSLSPRNILPIRSTSNKQSVSRNSRQFGISCLGLPTKRFSPSACLIGSFGCSAFLPVHKVVKYGCDLSQSSYLLFQPLSSSSQLKLSRQLVLFHQIIAGWKRAFPEASCGIVVTIRHARYASVDDSQ
jgi:hypothetical protein